MDLVCPCSTEFRVTVSTESITPPQPRQCIYFYEMVETEML